jgi:hypothetical protein
MGFINADIVKQDDDYVWKGDKNLAVYEGMFEKYFLQRVSQTFIHHHILSKYSFLLCRVKMNTKLNQQDGWDA